MGVVRIFYRIYILQRIGGDVLKRWFAGSVMVLPLVALPHAQSAQPSGTEIHYGETVSGEIAEDVSCQYYWFEGTQGDPITLDMTRTSGGLDGVMSLYLRDGNQMTDTPVAFNDDRPGGTLDPLISTTLPETDWYTVAVCRLQNDQMRSTAGTFDLTLSGPAAGALSGGGAGAGASGGIPPTPTLTSSLTNSLFSDTAVPPGEAAIQTTSVGDTLLEYGTTIQGALGPDAPPVRYHLPVREGMVIRIEVVRTSGSFAPVLAVTTSSGVLIAQSGVIGDGTGLQLTFVAPGTDALTINVSYQSGQGKAAGTYNLSVEQVDAN